MVCAEIELPLGDLEPRPRRVTEADHPDLVLELERTPPLLEGVLADGNALVSQVPAHGGAERLGGLPEAGFRIGHRPGPLDHLGLLCDDGHGEALDPLDVDASLSGHLRDRPSGSQVGLDLARRQAAVGARPVAATLLVALLAVAQPLGLGDGGEQLLVERHQVAAGLRAFARAEDKAIKIGREPDEVEFLHARSR